MKTFSQSAEELYRESDAATEDLINRLTQKKLGIIAGMQAMNAAAGAASRKFTASEQLSWDAGTREVEVIDNELLTARGWRGQLL